MGTTIPAVGGGMDPEVEQSDDAGPESRAARFDRAMAIWLELTGLDPEGRSFTLGEWSLVRATEEVAAARVLDPSDITSSLMLGAVADGYFGRRSFPVAQLLDDPARVVAYLERARTFRDLINAPDIRAIGGDFAAAVEKGLAHYGADRPEVLAVVRDLYELAFLRRDALRSMATLRVDQFLTGEPEPDGVTPQYLDTVHQFWNINSLLRTMVGMPSGVMMALIRDRDAFQSYFVFAIRNGGRLFLLSDGDKHAHPLQRYMSRRPDRDLGRRAERNWFPYDLLDFKVNDDGEIYFPPTSDGTAIVPYQRHSICLKPIRDLGPRETVWTTMMLDLIVERFWRQGTQAPELSYTGEMIRNQAILAEHAGRQGLAVQGYQTIDVAALTVADVLTGAADPEAVGIGRSRDRDRDPEEEGQNAWLERRYAPRIQDAAALNLLALPKHGLCLPGRGDAASVVSGSTLPDKAFVRDNRQTLHAQDPTTFGTRKQLLADRVFIARHNLAKQIQVLADQEYEERHDEVRAWFKQRVTANIDALLPFALHKQVHVRQTTGGNVSFCGRRGDTRYPFVRRIDLDDKDESKHDYSGLGALSMNQGWNHERRRALCWVTGASARYKVVFTPYFLPDLCALAGLPRSGLPDVLQHWQREEEYVGNSILDRVDPMVWALYNPWRKLHLEVVIWLSQSGFNRLGKTATPPALDGTGVFSTLPALG